MLYVVEKNYFQYMVDSRRLIYFNLLGRFFIFFYGAATEHLYFYISTVYGVINAIFMDLSKAYNFLSHDLQLAKLEAYGFDLNSLNLIHSYLSSRQQRVKVGSSFSK